MMLAANCGHLSPERLHEYRQLRYIIRGLGGRTHIEDTYYLYYSTLILVLRP